MKGRLAGLLVLAVIVSTDADAQSKGKCPPVQVDSTVSDSAGVLPPTYIPCQVDREARLRGRQPSVAWQPMAGEVFAGGCFRAEFEFVVDSLGHPESESIRTGYATNSAYADAVRRTIPLLRYDPARLKGARVRQLVTYEKKAQIRASATGPGSGTGMGRLPASPPAFC